MNDWYFAYGSNLWIEQMVQRTGLVIREADPPRLVRLPGYRLAFNMQGIGAQVYANIVRPGDGVLGVIYRCGPDTLEMLDDYEAGYYRRKITVVDDRGANCETFVYIAKPKRIAEGRKPSDEYLQRILRGARQHGLPEAYIQGIMSIAGDAGQIDELDCEFSAEYGVPHGNRE